MGVFGQTRSCQTNHVVDEPATNIQPLPFISSPTQFPSQPILVATIAKRNFHRGSCSCNRRDAQGVRRRDGPALWNRGTLMIEAWLPFPGSMNSCRNCGQVAPPRRSGNRAVNAAASSWIRVQFAAVKNSNSTSQSEREGNRFGAWFFACPITHSSHEFPANGDFLGAPPQIAFTFHH